jgi:ATP-dependent helicase/nuclease subunit B
VKPFIPLEKTESLPAQVAAHLLLSRTGRPVDLGDTLVLIPTAGAGRAIRRELSKTGVLSPRFLLPMDALVPGGHAVAGRLEREVAWVRLLDPARRKTFASLIPGAVPLDTPDDRFGVASRLCHVCDQLAEAGLDPVSPELPAIFNEDARRWTEFGQLYAAYLGILAKHGIRDPNAVRLEQARSPEVSHGLKRVVVACIPDLAPVVETYLISLGSRGISIDILAWSPKGRAKHLDAMGRPGKEWSKAGPLRVERTTIVPANDPATEAGLLLDFVGAGDDGDFELFAAAPESAVALAQEIAWRGAESYLPEGRALAQTESAEILLGWDVFASTRRLRDLRVLLQKPAFLAFLVAEAGPAEKFTANDALGACDRLISQRLCENVPSARSWLRHAGRPTNKGALKTFTAQEDLVRTVEKLLARQLDGRGMLSAVNGHRGTVAAGSSQSKELAAIAEVTGQFDHSALLRELPEEIRRSAAKADLLRKRIFPRPPSGAVEVQGWLEAPWSSARTLVIAGCREGALPSGTCDDPFLPDKAKENLGLVTQDKRLARDAYLLSCLLSSRPSGQVRLGFARFRNQGEPNRPSRLLFSCADSELPDRSGLLLKPAPRSKRKDRNDVGFPLRMPKATPEQFPPRSIRVTAFRNYLECPLRFYLGTILGLRQVDPDAREIPATDFGTLMHEVLEDFAKNESLAGLRRSEEIAHQLSGILDVVAPRHYGENPSPVVRVQIESMRSRLKAFAETEASLRSQGWKTLETEYSVKAEDHHLLGGLPVTGTIDRIDVHPEKGLRILDYKTYAQPKNPSETHLGLARKKEHLPEADFQTFTKKGKPQPRSWTDLQLPLYAWLARKIWPELADKGVEVGYLLLPTDGETGEKVLQIFDLTPEMQSSAEACAERIAQRVKAGHFWPPSPPSEVPFDDYRDWFMGADPQKRIDDESARWLKGNQ